MIQQEHLTVFPKQEIPGQSKVTMPGLSIDVKRALQQYAMGTMEERAKGYYEKLGEEIPDFHKMSKIERLVSLNEIRKKIKEQQGTINNIVAKAQADKKEAILQQTVKQKVDEAINTERAKGNRRDSSDSK